MADCKYGLQSAQNLYLSFCVLQFYPTNKAKRSGVGAKNFLPLRR
jgi:hypothetical protein